MSKLVQKLIRKCKATHSKTLDLGNCGLRELPKELFDCVWLEELIVGDSYRGFGKDDLINSANKGQPNLLSTLPGEIGQLASLKALHLGAYRLGWDWEITNVSALKKLKKLEVLDLSYNQVNNLSFLSKFTKLKALYVRDNPIRDYGFFAELSQLTHLDLRDNQINNIDFLSKLTQLTSLDLSSNQINDYGVLGNFTQLRSLSLSFSQINDYSFLENLPELKELDLSLNGIHDYSFLENLTGLTDLDLSFNRIRNYSFLENLAGLTSLSLRNNQIRDTQFFTNLIQLTKLDLMNNQIEDISTFSKLDRLTRLNLMNNQIREARPLSNLARLTRLNLAGNFVDDYNFLENLTKLTNLDLTITGVTDASFLANLTQLTSLDLRNNRIDNHSFLAGLGELTNLDLRNNQMSDISPLANLTKLTSLNLRNNQINDISPLANLTKLTNLDLRANLIKDLSPLEHLLEQEVKIGWVNSEGISVRSNPVEIPPPEIINESNEVILRYFEQMEAQGMSSLYEAKMLIVGEPDAGKTTLLNKLINPAYKVPNDEVSTVGINIHEGWAFDCRQKGHDKTFKANLWDFGGQEIQYMLHQFFLTPRSLYVLVADNRRQHTNFPYWFRIIHLLGKDQEGSYSPVLVVLNQINHQSVSNFNHRLHAEKYPGLEIREIEIDFAQGGKRMEALTEQIQHMLSHLPHVGKAQLPTQWTKVRAALRKLAEKHSYITFEQYTETCEKHQIVTTADQLLLGKYLHNLGVVLHFQEAIELRNIMILRPEWAVDAIYSILASNQVAKDKGRFSEAFVFEVWQQKGYSFIEQGYLLSLMRKDIFEICYPVPYEPGTYIAPLLLPDIACAYAWDNARALRFRYQYAFMPPGILTRLIVRLSEWIIKENNEEVVWKTGVVLTKYDCQAQVIEQETREGNKAIDIAISGNDSEKKYVLRQVRDEINQIHLKSFPSLKPTELVPCVCARCRQKTILGEEPEYHKYDVLVNWQNKNRIYAICPESAEDVSIQKLLEGIYDNDELRSSHSMPTFNQAGMGIKECLSQARMCLQKADYPGYFEVLPESMLPNKHKHTYNHLRNTFISGAPADFHNKLAIFTQQLIDDLG